MGAVTEFRRRVHECAATRGAASPYPFRVPARVEEATAASEELTAAMWRLIGEVSSSARAPTQDELQAVVDSPATRLLVARDASDRIVGSLTLAMFRTATGVGAGLHDLEIDRTVSEHGVAEMLIMEALRLAHDFGVRTVDLTSWSGRESTDDWYRRLGFKERITVYRRALS
jgi:GNAT superfamily N-acetyltransferase